MVATRSIPTLNGPGGFIVSEANGYRSRDAIYAAKGSGILPAGMILAQLTAVVGDGKVGEFVPWVSGGANGTGTVAGVLFQEVDTTAAAVNVTGIMRSAEIQRSALAFAGTPDATAKAAAYAGLAAKGLVLR
jgi:hypothetical protein